MSEKRLANLVKEANELVSILTAIVKRARANTANGRTDSIRHS